MSLSYKVLMIAPTSFFSDTGCHVRIYEEIRILQEAGHQVKVCTYHTGGAVDGIDIVRTPDIPWYTRLEVGSSRHKLYFDILLALRSIQASLKFKPDIIHAHIHEGALIGFPVKWLTRFGCTPLIFDFQGSLTGEMIDHQFLKPDGFFYQPTLWLEKLINRLPNRIVTSSHNAAQILEQQFGVPSRRIATISDRVNYRLFSPAVNPSDFAAIDLLKVKHGIPANRKVVVYLGLLATYQGTDVLLEAARLLKDKCPEALFLVMGYPGVEKYAQKVVEMGLQDNVILTGRINYFEAPQYLRLGEVAVAPKMSTTEGAGKITTYMGLGLPVVTFNTPVSREILGDLGTYADFGSAESLAEHLLDLLTNPEKAQSLGAALRAKALRELSQQQALHEWETLYAELIATANNRRPRLALPASASEVPTNIKAQPNFSADSSFDGSADTNPTPADWVPLTSPNFTLQPEDRL